MHRTPHGYQSVKRKLSLLFVLLLALVTGFTAAKAQSPPTGLVSVNMSGSSSSDGATMEFSPAILPNTVSADGRYAVFTSTSSDLVPNDNNGVTDIFRRDLLTGQTTLVSINASGTASGNSSSDHPVITPDGRYVVFKSSASNLVTDDAATLFGGAIYVRDMQLGVTRLVDRNLAGTAHGNGTSGLFETLEISADGRYVAFVSTSSDLVLNDGNNQQDVFVRDLQTNSTILVSRNLAGTASGNNASYNPIMTPDGRYVAFRSSASDLVANDTNGPREDIFLRDLQTGVTKLVSINRFGTGSGNGPSDYRAQSDLAISPDGRYVAFVSSATDLVDNDNNGLAINDEGQDVFVRDMQLEKSMLVSVDSAGVASANGNSGGLALTPDGRFVAFLSNATNLVANTDSNNLQDVFVRDLVAGTTTLISVNRNGAAGGGWNTSNSPVFYANMRPRISSDGRYVSFVSRAGDLTQIDNYPPNPNALAPSNVYVRDRQPGRTTLVSVNTTGTKDGMGSSTAPVMTPDGRFIFYFSHAPDLVANDTNGVGDVFYYINITQPGQLQFQTAVNSINEGAGSIAITVTILGGLSSPVSVNYSTANGTATAGSDYLAASGTLTFTPGEMAKTFNVSVLDDSLDEDDETIYLKLSNPTGSASLGEPRVAAIVIADDDPLPALSINDVSVTEGNTGTTDMNFTAALSAASGKVVRVNFVTEAGTAASGTDYVLRNNILTFNPGETAKTITVRINGDTQIEPDETLFVNLSNPSNATIAKSKGTGTILNDDGLQPTVQFQQSSYSIAEGAGSLSLLINRSGDPSLPVTINYTTSDAANFLQNCNVLNGAATSRCDYVGVLGTLHFASGETSKTISIPIVDDTYVEGTESFFISLSSPSGGAVLGTNQRATIQITDNSNDVVGIANPIDDANFFVRQHYIDFLSREPDPLSAGWITILNGCTAGDQSCRLSVSQGIYGSPEFRDRGYFIYKFYSVSLGRKPSYDEFNLDRARVSGFQTDAELEQSKVDFISDFMSRAEFASIYNGLSNNAYVQRLYDTVGITQVTTAGGVLNVAGMQQSMNTGKTRATVLREIAESAEASARFLTESTVVMHYFGYLRRDPDAAYQGWINILNSTGDSRNVTSGFINSPEYRARFGQ